MSNEYQRSRSSSSYNIPWLWIWALIAIISIIVIARSFSNSINISSDRPHLMVSPEGISSTIFISMTESSKNRLTGTGAQPLYIWDKSISVETGWARATNDNISIDLDERTELSYNSHSSTGDALKLVKWKIWIEQISSNGYIEMKNLSVITKKWSIVMLEQLNPVFSTVYSVQWDVTISTSIGEYVLKAGNRIMLSATELANPWLQLSSQVGSIDADIMKNTLFIKNNGKELLTNLNTESTSTGAVIINTGSVESSSSFISFLEPLDGSLINKTSISVRGTINSKDIKRVTLNDIDTSVSPVNNTFTFLDFPITAEVNNIVYKAYNMDGRQVEKWVITIFGSKQAIQSTNRLISNNSPISSKDFRILSPASNPFVTTERFIKVQWTVPKDTVNYIIVNDYRLQKYISGSATWYYYANMDNETLRDWINLYTIKFFGEKDELLYTQLFTIIKETKNVTLSGESSR